MLLLFLFFLVRWRFRVRFVSVHSATFGLAFDCYACSSCRNCIFRSALSGLACLSCQGFVVPRLILMSSRVAGFRVCVFRFSINYDYMWSFRVSVRLRVCCSFGVFFASRLRVSVPRVVLDVTCVSFNILFVVWLRVSFRIVRCSVCFVLSFLRVVIACFVPRLVVAWF